MAFDKSVHRCTWFVAKIILNVSCRHDGLIIMATNRPFDLDEAMHRRITIALEFRQPDHLLRKAIWESHIPADMKVDKNVDLVSFERIYFINKSFLVLCRASCHYVMN